MVDLRLLLALWVSVLTLSSFYASSRWLVPWLYRPAIAADKVGVVLRKLPAVTVPILSAGQVRGYVVAKMTIELSAEKFKSEDPPDPYVIDEAFRVIYSEAGINFQNLERADLQKIKTHILKNLALRLKSDVGRDLLFEEFNYVPRSDVGK